MVSLSQLFYLVVPRYRVVSIDAGDGSGKKFVYLAGGFQRAIPDEFTVEVLGYNPNNLTTVSEEFLSLFAVKDPVETMQITRSDADDLKRIATQKIELMMAVSDIAPEVYFLPDRLNPSIGSCFNRTIVVFRTGMGENSNIWFRWLPPTVNFTTILREFDMQFLQIESWVVETLDFNLLQEDPRVLVLSNGSIAIAYTSKHSLFEAFHQCYIVLNYDSRSYTVNSPSSVNLDQPHLQIRGKVREHVLFVYSSST